MKVMSACDVPGDVLPQAFVVFFTLGVLFGFLIVLTSGGAYLAFGKPPSGLAQKRLGNVALGAALGVGGAIFLVCHLTSLVLAGQW